MSGCNKNISTNQKVVPRTFSCIKRVHPVEGTVPESGVSERDCSNDLIYQNTVICIDFWRRVQRNSTYDCVLVILEQFILFMK